MLNKLVEACRAVRVKVLPVLLHKALKVRIFPHSPIAQHLVERLHHILDAFHILRRHIFQLLFHALEEVLHHLLLERIQQLVELLPRVRIHKVVLLQLAYLAARALRQRVKRLGIAPRAILQHPHRRLQMLGVVACLLHLPPRLIQAPLNAAALGVQHILQPLPHVVHNRIQVIPLQLALPLLTQPLHKIPQPRRLLPLPVVHAALKQATQRAIRIPVFQNIVRDRVEQVVGVHIKNPLAAVPAVVLESSHNRPFWEVRLSVCPVEPSATRRCRVKALARNHTSDCPRCGDKTPRREKLARDWAGLGDKTRQDAGNAASQSARERA